MIKAVFDTVIFVRGLINPFNWCGRLVFDYSRAYQLFVSPAILAEYQGVFIRPELVRKYRSAATRDLKTIWEIIGRAKLVQPKETPAICRDPADDKFLAAAVAGGASFIVTEDADLLDLGSYEEIDIILSKTFLAWLEEPESPLD